jgi:hypothetical protein
MAEKELVKTEASLTAANIFSDAIPIEGKFNVLVTGTFVGTMSLQKKHVSDIPIEGVATATTTDKLVDSTKDFTALGVRAGDWVHNTTDGTYAMVSAVDSATTLSISGNVMASGEEYIIERWWDLMTSGQFTAPADKQLEECEGGVKYRIGCTAYTSGTAIVRISK